MAQHKTCLRLGRQAAGLASGVGGHIGDTNKDDSVTRNLSKIAIFRGFFNGCPKKYKFVPARGKGLLSQTNLNIPQGDDRMLNYSSTYCPFPHTISVRPANVRISENGNSKSISVMFSCHCLIKEYSPQDCKYKI